MAAIGDVCRSLHWVYKVGNLQNTVEFYTGVLGLYTLRHEEFSSGCEATCNGPYAGAWSKTMIGTGPETERFALELTYNYGVNSYRKGNDLRYILFQHSHVKDTSKIDQSDEGSFLTDPNGYHYKLVESENEDPFVGISINVSDLDRSVDFWCNVLGLQRFETIPGKAENSVVVGFAQNQCKLELVPISEPVDHGSAFGRVAFSTRNGPNPYFESATQSGDTVINTPIVLPTPGKADVEVTILADRDGYEICFVGEAGFNDLCTTKPGDEVIDWDARAEKGADGHGVSEPASLKFEF